MRTPLNAKIGPIQNTVLEILGEATMVTLAFLTSGANSARFAQDIKRNLERRNKESIIQSIKKLKRNRLVDIKEKGGEEFITLSENGKKRILQYKFKDLTFKNERNWDKKWRIMMFDIPERYGKARRALSKKLKDMGAFPLQKSVFIFPYPCRNEIDFVTEFFHVSPYVRYSELIYIEGEKELRRHFGL